MCFGLVLLAGLRCYSILIFSIDIFGHLCGVSAVMMRDLVILFDIMMVLCTKISCAGSIEMPHYYPYNWHHHLNSRPITPINVITIIIITSHNHHSDVTLFFIYFVDTSTSTAGISTHSQSLAASITSSGARTPKRSVSGGGANGYGKGQSGGGNVDCEGNSGGGDGDCEGNSGGCNGDGEGNRGGGDGDCEGNCGGNGDV